MFRSLLAACFLGVAVVGGSLLADGLKPALGIRGSQVSVEPGPGFRVDGADVTLLAVLEDGTRVYRAYGPKMVFASVIVVGPDGRATIRQ